MPRAENDTWSIAESVGATAVFVAAARAMETAKPAALINDPHARTLVFASGIPFFAKALRGELDVAAQPEAAAVFDALVSYQAARTHVFDGFFREAAEAGIRQAVILASGLDSRAYRLGWPAGTTVYELDQPQVIAFKTQTLADAGVRPAAALAAIPVDLRDDWPKALLAEGFDSSQPSAWLAEGLLGYLPTEAERLLFERIDQLAAPGSRVAVEDFQLNSQSRERLRHEEHEFAQLAPDLSMNIDDLIYDHEEQLDVPGWLVEHGFDVTNTSSRDVLEGLGRAPTEETEEAAPASFFVLASR